jgi:predicted acylesterase/phospholipase RssA
MSARLNLDVTRLPKIDSVAKKLHNDAQKIKIDASALGHRPFKHFERIGFALSGGGAKGCFQIGALRFLMEMRGIKPQMIAGTSVGSVNASKLAEGDKPPANDPSYKPGLAGLIDIWHGLKKSEDMAVPIKAISEFASLAFDEVLSIGMDVAAAGFGVGSGLLVPVLPCAGASIDPSIDNLKKLAHDALFAGGIWSLSPTKEMMLDRKKFRPDLVANSPIKLFICWVGMLSGETFYVDNDRRLFVAPDFKTVVGSVDRIEDAIHASAAIPLVFKSPVVKGTWKNKPFGDLGFDGGVTEVAPVEILAAHNATKIFAIACAPAEPIDLVTGEAGTASDAVFQKVIVQFKKDNKPVTEEHFFAEMEQWRSILTVGQRGLDLAVSETLREDLRVPGTDVTVIRPYVVVNDTQQIEPGLVQANEGQGWMCAFDAEIPPTMKVQQGRELIEKPNPAWEFARKTTKAITLARRDNANFKRAKALSKKIFGDLGPNPFADAGVMKWIDEKMQENRVIIREGVESRWKNLGLAAAPVTAGTWDDE